MFLNLVKYFHNFHSVLYLFMHAHKLPATIIIV